MNIILTIKSILNYLYNHLIDLIYVKKIKFENGSEITGAISSNNIYDIKLLSQIIANKGFSFLCHNTKKFLSQNDVPTVYNDIKNKYDNCDFTFSTVSTYTNKPVIQYDNGYFYFVNDYKVKKSATIDLGSPIDVINLADYLDIMQNSQEKYNLLKFGDTWFLMYSKYSGGATWYFAFFNNDWTLKYANINVDDYIKNRTIGSMFFDNQNSVLYFTNSNNQLVSVNANNGVVTVLSTNVPQLSHSMANSMVKVNNMLIFLSKNTNAYPTINYFNLDTNVMTGGTAISLSYGSWQKSCLLYDNNTLYLIGSDSSKLSFMTSSDLGATWSAITNTSYSWGNHIEVVKYNNTIYILLGNNSGIIKTTDWINFEQYITFNYSEYGDSYFNYMNLYDNGFFVLSNVQSFNISSYLFSSYIKTVYTDSLTINGSLVSVNYYKYNEWKIAISDGGSNDNAINTFFNFYGYENYFLLDINNSQIALPRNSNLYTVMFVGNDFIDSVDDLINGNYMKLLTENEVIEDLSSNSVTFNSSNPIKVNSSYKFGELSALTLDTDCYSQNPFGITIEFSSGATATTLTDNSSIVWVDGSSPVPSANKTCLIFIWNNKGFYKEY